MSGYNWTCFACGLPNVGDAPQCTNCGCPPSPSHQQIRTFHEAHLACHGTISSELEKSMTEAKADAKLFGQMVRWFFFLLIPL